MHLLTIKKWISPDISIKTCSSKLNVRSDKKHLFKVLMLDNELGDMFEAEEQVVNTTHYHLIKVVIANSCLFTNPTVVGNASLCSPALTVSVC